MGRLNTQVKVAKALRKMAHEERNKAAARLDEFTIFAATPQGEYLISQLSLKGLLSTPLFRAIWLTHYLLMKLLPSSSASSWPGQAWESL